MADLHKKSTQYDMPLEKQDLMLRNWEKRQRRREEFQRMKFNPIYRQHNPLIFDDAVDRYQAMKIKKGEFFKPNMRTSLTLIGWIMPFVVFMYLGKKEQDAKELKYRTGQVAYKDRQYKLIV